MPTYVLSKVKRTGAGQKVGDLVDQEAPSTELAAGSIAGGDRLAAQDVSETDDPWKWVSFTALRTWLQGVLSLAAGRITSGTLSLARGGTNAGSAGAARTSLGLGSAATRTAGNAAANVPILNSNARLDPARMGSGSDSGDSNKFLRRDGVFAELVPFDGATVKGVGVMDVNSGATEFEVDVSYLGVSTPDAVVGDRLTVLAFFDSSSPPDVSGVRLVRRGIDQTLVEEASEHH